MVVGYIFYLFSNKSIALLINAFKLSPFAFAFSWISSFLPFATIRLILSYACLLNSLLYLIAFVLSLYAITAPPINILTCIWEMKRLIHIDTSSADKIPKLPPLCVGCVKQFVCTFPIVTILYHNAVHYAMYFLHKKKLKTLCNVPIDEHYTMCYTIITARATARTLNKRIKGG